MPIDRLAITGIDDVDRDLADVLQFAAGFLEQHVDVLHRLLRLAGGIADADALGRVQVLADLPAQEDGTAARDDGLAQIVVELLFRGLSEDPAFAWQAASHKGVTCPLMVGSSGAAAYLFFPASRLGNPDAGGAPGNAPSPWLGTPRPAIRKIDPCQR
ncbi:hypothetical protein G6F22_018548 [Rhizopus arrhizus]|nr:hypothetical protein G6F22_018548 [Rhizopus arrhizus]